MRQKLCGPFLLSACTHTRLLRACNITLLSACKCAFTPRASFKINVIKKFGVLYNIIKGNKMTYQTLEEAIFHENLNNREELIDLLKFKYAAHKGNTDLELLEKINRYCSEDVSRPERFLANDPIEW